MYSKYQERKDCSANSVEKCLVLKKTFTPFGVPGKPEATLVPETGVAAAQHIYTFQAKPVPT